MAYAQGPRAPAVCRRSTGGQPSQPRSCSPRPALCGGATEQDGPPACRRLTHPQLRYPLGRAWDPLSHPLSHHIRPEQSRVLSTYGTHSPPTSGTPTPGHSVASNRKFSFPRTIVISNGYLFFSGRNFGLESVARTLETTSLLDQGHDQIMSWRVLWSLYRQC